MALLDEGHSLCSIAPPSTFNSAMLANRSSKEPFVFVADCALCLFRWRTCLVKRARTKGRLDYVLARVTSLPTKPEWGASIIYACLCLFISAVHFATFLIRRSYKDTQFAYISRQSPKHKNKTHSYSNSWR